jgi:hypothetical protein
MIAEWAIDFRRWGYTPAELDEATSWLATHQPPRYRSEHLPGLIERVRSRREKQSQAPPEDARGECALCGGCGRVIVPRPGCDPCGGRWYTQAVLCRCPLGRWYGDRLAARCQLTLDAYEREVPHWRGLAEEHDRYLRSLAAHDATARRLDRPGDRGAEERIGELAERLLARYRAQGQRR